MQDNDYQRIIYSAAQSDPGMIGTSIFHVDDDVRRYCVTVLEDVVKNLSGAEDS